MIISGEVSGDLHGAALVEAIKNIDDRLNIYGIGGDKMKAAGMTLNYHIKRMAFLGFTEVVKHIPFIKKIQKNLIDFIKDEKIKIVILIDYPGFNLNFAKKLKPLNVKIVYYISPQIWAWGAGRIKKIKRLVDKMLVVFPFEENFYNEAGVDVEFVGHPLLERIEEMELLNRDELSEKFKLDKNKDILLLLPGSRENEVNRIFPEVIKAADKISREFNLQIVVAGSENISEEVFYSLSEVKDFKVVKGSTYSLMKNAKLGIIKSGTSTLEAGLFQLPMVIVYKTSVLTYLIGRRLVRVKNIGMANIILNENVVPELIQNDVNEESIYIECKKILTDDDLYGSIKGKLNKIKEKLGTKGASEKAAKSIYSLMNEN